MTDPVIATSRGELTIQYTGRYVVIRIEMATPADAEIAALDMHETLERGHAIAIQSPPLTPVETP